MNRIQNEKGFALITAILAIVVFSVLGVAIMTITNQGHKQRDLSNEQIEGRMLADTGLLYFQKKLETQLNTDFNKLKNSMSTPSVNDDLMQEIAALFPNPVINLPDGKGAFQIQYNIQNLKTWDNKSVLSAIPYKETPYSQPYVRKLNVSVIGIPADTSHFKKVMVSAVLYINTIASPFHYAIYTPNELHLFGGSNIIGNISANQIYVSKHQYYHSSYDQQQQKDVYSIEQGDTSNQPYLNQPYVEGKIKLAGNNPALKMIDPFSQMNQGKPTFTVPTQSVDTNRTSLMSQNLFMPKGTVNQTGIVSANPNTPYIPGSEPPLFELNSDGSGSNQDLSFNGSGSLADYIQSQFLSQSQADKTINATDSPLWLGENQTNRSQPNNGFSTDFSPTSSDTFICSNQGNIISTNNNQTAPFLLTARLTGNPLPTTNRLFIGPSSTNYNSQYAAVEMGENSSFYDQPDNSSNDPFTFNGSIFIKGNLDIVGNVNINGTIYVDGNVIIREIGGDTNFNSIPNLVILSTGKITIMYRNTVQDPSNMDWTTIPRLSVFLYSDTSPIEVYSTQSVNWFYGGLATGTGANHSPNQPKPYIELNTKRESSNFASHMTIQFNRGIFEKETPGLPSAGQFFFDTYDINYTLVN